LARHGSKKHFTYESTKQLISIKNLCRMENKALKSIIFICLLSLISIGVLNFDAFKFCVEDRKWQWIRKKIFNSERESIDIAIVGSSYSWCAIRPSTITKGLDGLNAFNFGRNWHGRDVDYFIIKYLVKKHKVNRILLEFRDIENQEPHQYTKYLIGPKDAVSEICFNLRVLSYTDVITYSQKFKRTITYTVELLGNLSVRPLLQSATTLLGNSESGEIDGIESGQGFYVHGDTHGQEKSFAKMYRNKEAQEITLEKSKCNRNNYLVGSRSDYYLKKIKSICEINDTRLSFVYVPTFIKAYLPAREKVAYYKTLGEVLLPNVKGLFKVCYWRDKNHMFKEGSSKFTKELIFLMKYGPAASPYFQLY